MSDMAVGTATLTASADFYTVASAFGFSPTAMVCIVAKPGSTDSNIFATLRDGTLTASGFTVDFSTAIPASGYKLGYIVLGP